MSGSLKRYTVEVNGYETTLQLSEEDAKARGLVEDKPAAEPAAKAPAKKAAPRAANKARRAANK